MAAKSTAICCPDTMPKKIVTMEEMKEIMASIPPLVFQDNKLSGSPLAQEQQCEIIEEFVSSLTSCALADCLSVLQQWPPSI